MSSFQGFPADAPAFLADLGANNTVDFFAANEARWHGSLLEPGRLLVDALGPRLQEIDPQLQFSAKVNGSLFTIRRDTRFSNDKRPYKEELGLKFWHGDNRKACQSTLHMRITSTFVGFGAGVWTFEPAELLTYRAAVADDVLGPELVAAMAGLQQSQCVWQKDAYKKVPAPYPVDHPRQDLLRLRGLAVGFDAPLPASLHDASFVDFCVQQFERIAPVHLWLAQALDQRGA